MTCAPQTCGLFVLALALPAAVFPSRPDDWTRQGNKAFARGDYASALESYTRAEGRTTDPGLVAFNKAAALYRLGRYREAELHYRRCREDAAGPRLARLLYGLGNCLVQQAQGRDARLIEQAIDSYQQCLDREEADAGLRDDARYNLELAKLLLVQARASGDQGKPPNSDSGEDDKPSGGRAPRTRPGHDPPSAAAARRAKGDPKSREAGDPRTGPVPVDQSPPPGQGNLPPIPDEDELATLSPEDAAEHLRRAAQRIAREQWEHRQRSLPVPSRTVKDW